MDMEDRITVLEREVDAIRSELAVMRHAHRDAEELSGRVARMELDLAVIKGDVSQVQRDVAQLHKDVAKLTDDIVGIRLELARMNTEHVQYATKADIYALVADVKSLEARMKGWMLVIALSLMTSVFAMIYPLYGLRMPPVVKPAQTQQVIPLSSPAPAALK